MLVCVRLWLLLLRVSVVDQGWERRMECERDDDGGVVLERRW